MKLFSSSIYFLIKEFFFIDIFKNDRSITLLNFEKEIFYFPLEGLERYS
jgi:hypothetical protein